MTNKNKNNCLAENFLIERVKDRKGTGDSGSQMASDLTAHGLPSEDSGASGT